MMAAYEKLIEQFCVITPWKNFKEDKVNVTVSRSPKHFLL